jgi:hypothetical protein
LYNTKENFFNLNNNILKTFSILLALRLLSVLGRTHAADFCTRYSCMPLLIFCQNVYKVFFEALQNFSPKNVPGLLPLLGQLLLLLPLLLRQLLPPEIGITRCSLKK